MASVNNTDFPSKPGLSAEAQQQEWVNLLAQLRDLGLNAVVVQIRPSADALYPSALVPWSKFLTGKQGLPPSPYYDPLQFMVETAHSMGFEFHAWMNPYRVCAEADLANLASNNVYRTHPEWLKKYAGKYLLNPALPEVRQHLTDVVAEVVANYDVDAIHFDDYFYPYKVQGENFDDWQDFANLRGAYDNIEDWRRNNVDELIQKVSMRIKQIKPNVRLGISPFGVWRNNDRDPLGSDSRAGVTCYDDLYADVLKWMKLGWIDYVAPQLYWNIGFQAADYEKLLHWWANNSYYKQLYIGQGVYKVGTNKEAAWSLASEIPDQIRLNRQSASNVQGSIFFNASSLLANKLGVADSLSMALFNVPAFPPYPRGAQNVLPETPEFIRFKNRREGLEVRWELSDANSVDAFALYRFDGNVFGTTDDPRNIKAIIKPTDGVLSTLDTSALQGQTYTYIVSSLSKQRVESMPSHPKTVRVGPVFPWRKKSIPASATEPASIGFASKGNTNVPVSTAPSARKSKKSKGSKAKKEVVTPKPAPLFF